MSYIMPGKGKHTRAHTHAHARVFKDCASLTVISPARQSLLRAPILLSLDFLKVLPSHWSYSEEIRSAFCI